MKIKCWYFTIAVWEWRRDCRVISIYQNYRQYYSIPRREPSPEIDEFIKAVLIVFRNDVISR
jgi:hypothetical protein